jgi:large subunit ribosomal protein L18
MAKTNQTAIARQRRHRRIRRKVRGTSARPRLAFYRSNSHLYCQVIDDVAGQTLAAASTRDKDLKGTPDTVEGAAKVGQAIASRAKAKGVETVVFDRGGFEYHGVVKSLADAAREAGLKF